MYHSKILHFSPFSTYTRIVKVQKIDKIKDWQRYGRTGTFIAALFIIGRKKKTVQMSIEKKKYKQSGTCMQCNTTPRYKQP